MATNEEYLNACQSLIDRVEANPDQKLNPHSSQEKFVFDKAFNEVMRKALLVMKNHYSLKNTGEPKAKRVK